MAPDDSDMLESGISPQECTGSRIEVLCSILEKNGSIALELESVLKRYTDAFALSDRELGKQIWYCMRLIQAMQRL